jgi:Raf kinase inhibitor-like YbhB/YbcL family protein
MPRNCPQPHLRLLAAALVAALCLLGLPACNVPATSMVSDALDVARPPVTSMVLLSPHMPQKGKLRTPYACAQLNGQNQSPPMYWQYTPNGTNAFAITLLDLSVTPPAVLWGLINIPGDYRSIVQNQQNGQLPGDAWEITTAAGTVGYDGPCPPAGESHLFLFTIYALRDTIGFRTGTVLLEDIADELESKTILSGELGVTYP